MAKDFSKAFYKSIEWQKVRESVLMRDKYLCVNCGKPAEEVHHIIHLTPENINKPNITLNPMNLTSLCRACHFDEHKKDKAEGIRKRNGIPEYEYEFDENGVLIPRNSEDGQS